MRFTGIPKEQAEHYFSEAWAFLRPAVDLRQQLTKESVQAGILGGDLQLWCVFSGEQMVAAVVTEIADYPRSRECIVVLCGGEDSADWLHFLSVIEAWAAAAKCQRAVIDGRMGWAKKLPDYKPVAVTLSKELS